MTSAEAFQTTREGFAAPLRQPLVDGGFRSLGAVEGAVADRPFGNECEESL